MTEESKTARQLLESKVLDMPRNQIAQAILSHKIGHQTIEEILDDAQELADFRGGR